MWFNLPYSNQSILREINPEYSLEGLMLKLKFQYCSHLMWRVDSLEMFLMMGKIEGRRRRGQQRMRCLNSITDSMDYEFEQAPGDGKGQGSLACCSPWGCQESSTAGQLTKNNKVFFSFMKSPTTWAKQRAQTYMKLGCFHSKLKAWLPPSAPISEQIFEYLEGGGSRVMLSPLETK